MKIEKAELLRSNLFCCQACVPKNWTDEQAVEFVEHENPCGTILGWQVRKSGSDERVQCESRPDFVHIMFDA